MGRTFDDLTTLDGVTMRIVIAIEGYPNLLTDGDAAAAVTAWAGTDYTAALSGLAVKWAHQQALSPWEPFAGPAPALTFAVMDASGTNADTFALAVFKREGQVTSQLAADVTPTSTSIVVRSSDAFAASGTLYIGSEAIGYTTNTTGTETFTGLTRGKWSPFEISGGGGFARTHRAASSIEGFDADATTSTAVADAPLEWRGRRVGVWLHRDRGGVLDTRAEAHLAFAGEIADIIDDADGRTIVQCTSIVEAVRNAVVLREQWRARLQDGIYLDAGVRFAATDFRAWTSAGTAYVDEGEADDLVVVAAGATAPYQINAGQYTGEQIADAINDWLAKARDDGDLLLQQKFTYLVTDANGAPRSRLGYVDPTVSGVATHSWRVNADRASVRNFLGWDAHGIGADGVGGTEEGSALSASAPLRIAAVPSGYLKIKDVQGSFVDQHSYMRPAFLALMAAGVAKGIVRIGDAIMVCAEPSGTSADGTLQVQGTPALLLNDDLGADPSTAWPGLAADADGNVEIVQMLVLDAPFKTLALAMLASTGGGANWPAYDVLPAQCGAAIPYDLLTSTLATEIAATPQSDDALALIVDKPTRLADIFGVSFALRGLQFLWRQGRLTVKGYATPTSAATLSIGSDDRAAPIDTTDDQRAVTRQSDELMRNVVKVRHNASAAGDRFRDTMTFVVPGSVGNHGARPITLSARNALGPIGGGMGEDLAGLRAPFAARLALLAYPATVTNIPIPYTLFETATPGEVCLFSDPSARDPATGTRGITNRPALILRHRYDYGGDGQAPTGEIDVQVFTRLSLAPYCPTAQVDDGATNGGYVVATKVLTCKAHEHSEASEVADATRFVTGDKVRITQIDPDASASPLTWDDVVASQAGNTITLTTGLGGWDSSLLYRIYSDNYTDAVTGQRANAYQADDADGQVANARAPYGLAYFGAGQASTFTASAATELPSRPPTVAYGDGVALDTGHARDLARGLNNGRSYKWAAQVPEVVEEMTFGASGGGVTWRLVQAEPVFVGIGKPTSATTRKLYVAPTLCSTSGASVSVRVTLARFRPQDADRADVTRVLPYADATFTATSTTYATPAAVALDTEHLLLGEGPFAGWGWLYVEVTDGAKFRGFGLQHTGPAVAP